MPLKKYGAVKGRVIDIYGERRDDKSPHFYVTLSGGQREWRIAINVKSRRWPSEVAFLRLAPFTHSLTWRLEALSEGLTPMNRRGERRSNGLDYLHDNFFRLSEMVALPHHRPGRNNDLIDILYHDMAQARAEGWQAVAFGEPFNDRARRGLHNVHMNQGSTGRYWGTNGRFQDGALFLQAPEAGWIGYFWAFQSQASRTHTQTGHPVDDAPSIWSLLNGDSA